MFYDDCEQACGKCLNSTCNKTDGYCPLGCEAGYWGELCNDGNVYTFKHTSDTVKDRWCVVGLWDNYQILDRVVSKQKSKILWNWQCI